MSFADIVFNEEESTVVKIKPTLIKKFLFNKQSFGEPLSYDLQALLTQVFSKFVVEKDNVFNIGSSPHLLTKYDISAAQGT